MKHDKTNNILFFTRLILFLGAFLIPLFHPAIVVPYDRPGWWLWFFIVPVEMSIGFYLAPPRLKPLNWILSASGFLIISALIFTIVGGKPLLFFSAGAGAFILTAIVFRTGEKGHYIATLEPFFLAFIYYKLINFSRSSEFIASESTGFTQLLLILITFLFLIHGIVLYYSAFRQVKTIPHPEKVQRKKISNLITFIFSGFKSRSNSHFKPLKPGTKTAKIKSRIYRELFILSIIILPIVLLFIMILPPDFIEHSIVLNRLGPEPEPQPINLDIEGGWPENGNVMGQEEMGSRNGRFFGSLWNRFLRRKGSKGENGQRMQGRLEGVPADRWFGEGQGQGNGTTQKQYAVMIVATPIEPLYAAEAYFGKFDPEKGFIFSEDNPLNELSYIHLVDSWEPKEIPGDKKRSPYETFFMSTLSHRTVAYLPRRVEPTVMNRTYHPFDFSYRAVSLVSTSDPGDWRFVKELSKDEKNALSKYLEVNLPEETKSKFASYLEKLVKDRNNYLEKILAIYNSFSTFYYEIGFSDYIPTKRMEDFLFKTRRGDCSEFSNTAALLARMAGIPSRVVTGYLVSKSLQTRAHRMGIMLLRNSIEPLKQFPVKDLYLVTTAHHHSWVQLYIPGYGWVDTDPTSFAIPPQGMGNPNSMDVVIPIINVEEKRAPFKFPWILFAQIFSFLVGGTIVALYITRYGKEISLELQVKKRSPDLQSLNALYRLLLMKLAACGYGLKPPYRTALEYSWEVPQLQRFSMLYTHLRYRERFIPGEREALWKELLRSYNEIIKSCCKKPGLKNRLKKTFSLKGLHYIFS